MLSPAEQMLYNSVRLTAFKNGVPIQNGTGFFWDTVSPQGTVNTLVTNKHVIDGADALQIRLHVANENKPEPSGKTDLFTIVLHETGMVRHPDDDVDLCAISMIGLEKYTEVTGNHIFCVSTNSTKIPSPEEWSDLDAIEEVIMVGCPNGLFDEANGLPIIRRGITGSHPAFKYEGKDMFVIDAACFPGSSGSPVFLYNSSGYYDKRKQAVTIAGIRVKLLGILFAGPTIDQNGRIILTNEPQIKVSAMMHLGYVIRSSRLLEMDKIILELAIKKSQKTYPYNNWTT